MSNEMIEAVAKAIDPSTMNTKCHIPNCIECEGNKEIIRKQAKAAIEAMREPTVEMMYSPDIDMSSQHDIPSTKEIWQAMIDAALKDG